MIKNLKPLKSLKKKTNKNQPVRAVMARNSAELGLDLNDVVVVFACSDNFVPYMSVAIQSIIENSSEDRDYDIVVLTRDLSLTSMYTLSKQVKEYDNFAIGFLDVVAVLGDTELPHHGHFRPETYFRLLAPDFLDNVNKAVYLDSDLVVLDDIAKLYDTDIEGYLVGATKDADTIGQIDGYDPLVKPYLIGTLGMTNPYDYFQAGVLLMNLEEFRKQITPKEFLDIATQHEWHWLDQDILNKVVDGEYVRVPMRWNYLMDWQGLRRNHIVATAPQSIQDEYEEARKDIGIVHYAGPEHRPWHYPNADLAGFFWYYAKLSPYYQFLIDDLNEFTHSPKNFPRRAKAAIAFRGAMPFFNKTCPPGTVRRENITKAYAKLGGMTY